MQGILLRVGPCLGAYVHQSLLAHVPMQCCLVLAEGTEPSALGAGVTPPAPTSDPPVDTECVRAFREGGESAELSTMSPASTSHRPASVSWGLPHAASTQQEGDVVGPTAGSPRGPARAHPVGAQLGGDQGGEDTAPHRLSRLS